MSDQATLADGQTCPYVRYEDINTGLDNLPLEWRPARR